jgi:hypothetical protein
MKRHTDRPMGVPLVYTAEEQSDPSAEVGGLRAGNG